MSRNPYEILHLEEDASYDEIKERYRHLTKNLHPDKQSLENYQITKKLFEQIDEAYKSIASPLRRYLFREYGLPALKVLDEMPGEFQEYDVEQLSPDQIVKLRQLMIYMLYEREAGLEMDKAKFNTKTMLNISKMMRPKQGKTLSKRNLNFPEIENANFDYQMVLPEVYGFSNSLAFSHVGSNLRNDPKCQIGVTVSAMRRLYTSYMLAFQGMVSTDESTLDVTIDKTFQSNVHLKFTPISLYNMELARPKLSVEKAFNQFQFAAITDFGSTNFEFTESNSKPISKSLKLYIEQGSLGVMPKVEWQMGPDLRFFVQLSTGINFNIQDSSLSMQQSMIYGYKLMLNNDLKLQLTSSMGYPNYFQVCLTSSKFRVAIPLATAEPDQSRFELMKIAAMALVYFCYQAYHFKCRRDLKIRSKVMREQHNRLNEQRRQLQKQMSYLQMSALSRREKEVRYNGLVIIRAYLGDKRKIKLLQQRVTKAALKKTFAGREGVQECEEKMSDLIFLSGEIEEEVCEITLMVQNQVNGSQLINFDLEDLCKYNPCIFDNLRPYLLLVYLQRGEFKVTVRPCKGKISLGGFKEKKGGITAGVGRAWTRLLNYVIN